MTRKTKEQIAEQRKEYREKNKEKIAIYRKIHYEENKDKILEKAYKYNEKNKEHISEQRKEQRKTKVECECGVIITKQHLERHKKSKKHQNYINALHSHHA